MIKEKAKAKIEARFKGGGSITSLPPIFSKDSQLLYVARKNDIICYNTKTGNKFMEFTGLKQQIVGFNVGYIDNIEQVIACTTNGQILLWKANSGLKLKEIKTTIFGIRFFVVFCALDRDNSEILNALIGYENKSKRIYEFKLINLKTEEIVHHKIAININTDVCVDVGGNGRYFVVTQGNVLHFALINSQKIYRHKIKDRNFTCVICHPTEDAVLTGENTGRVLIWHNLRRQSPTQATYHWHTLPVKSAAFSASGTVFYSGGSECVLVKWLFENNDKKDFLARLPGFIEHITVSKDNLYLALATSDNAIQIVSPQLKIVTTIQHLALGNDASTGLVYDPRTRAIVLNGIVGYVQFFSPRDMNLLYSLDVVGQNKYTNERDATMINTKVSKLALDKTGLWMATVEYRPDPQMFECRLKFWFYDTASQSFTLNTSVEYPHEAEVLQLTFQPSDNEYIVKCVTIGDDKKFKIWHVVDIQTVYRKGHIWQCSGDVFYRDLTPNGLAFSVDGSLIAIGFDSIVTTWLPDSCELKCSLSHPIQKDPLKHLSFGTGPQCHLLLSATSTYISVWNLLTLSLAWSVRVDVGLVISDALTSYKAVFTEDKKMYVFEPKSSKPSFVSTKLLKNIGSVQSATFAPKISATSDVTMEWQKRSSIYILDTNFNLYGIECDEEYEDTKLHITEDTSKTFFGNILPQMKTALIQEESKIHTYVSDPKAVDLRKLLDTPPHALPPLHLLSGEILKGMIVQHRLLNNDSTIPEDHTNKSAQEKSSPDIVKLFDTTMDLEKIEMESTEWITVL